MRRTWTFSVVMLGDRWILSNLLGTGWGLAAALSGDGAARGWLARHMAAERNPARTPARSRYRRRASHPDQRAGCLGRGKGASRPFGIGLRPTLPPTSGSRIWLVVGS